MTEKMTNKKAMEMAIEMVTENGGSAELLEKLEKIKAGFDRKSGGSKKPTATQEENIELKEVIIEFLTGENSKRYTATELTKAVAELEELTNQRVTSLLTALVKEGRVNREVEKRKAYFFI